ncbi:hypothetical protein ABIF90_007241 [Bradyrhizobium japonicum]
MQNAFLESFNGRLRDEFLNETLFTSLMQARPAIEGWGRDYKHVGPHSRLASARGLRRNSPQSGQALRSAMAPRLGPLLQLCKIATPKEQTRIRVGGNVTSWTFRALRPKARLT